MKRIITFLLALCCLGGAFSVSALIPAHTNVVSSGIYTEHINNFVDDQAEMLKALGLFLGTDNGFELNRQLTRAETAALIVRALGGESAALSEAIQHPFTDVPEWADGYVGWLYRNKITNGVSETKYGSGQPVTYWQFATLLSRACSGNDNFLDSGVGKESEESLSDINSFYRSDAVGLLTRFLSCQYSINNTDGYVTVAQHLLHMGVFSAEQFLKAGVKVYPIYYSYFVDDYALTSSVLGIRMTTSPLKSIDGHSAYPLTELPYFYAWISDAEGTFLYKMDCLTLAETEIAFFAAADHASLITVEHFATVGGKDYLGLKNRGKASLVQVDGDKAEVLAEGAEFGFSYLKYTKPYIWNDNVFTVMLDDTVYAVTKDGVSRHRLDSGAKLVAALDTTAVLCREENGEAVIEGMNIADWTVTDTYRAALPKVDYFPVIRQNAKGIYGEAGLFIVRDGRLLRMSERPVLDVGGVRIGAYGLPVILTHGPESYFGDTIVVLNDPFYSGDDSWKETVRLSGGDHGIAISGVRSSDSAVRFYSSSPVGMENYDTFEYVLLYNSQEDHEGILVLSFSPGRPEVMEHDNQWYVNREQERLDALGYSSWSQT